VRARIGACVPCEQRAPHVQRALQVWRYVIIETGKKAS